MFSSGIRRTVSRSAGHKVRGIAARYVNLTDDQIRESFNEMFAKIFPTFSQEKTSRRGRSMTYRKCLKNVVRGAGFEPARRFRH